MCCLRERAWERGTSGHRVWNLGFGSIDGAKPVWRRRVLKQKSRAGRDVQASCVVLLVQHCKEADLEARFARGCAKVAWSASWLPLHNLC